MRIARLALVSALALTLGGCFQATTVISVKPDGSGTIDQTMAMTAEAAAQLQAMSAMGGEKADAKKGLFSIEEAKATAAKLGEGVTFVSAQPIHTAQQEGMKATYAFTDITKIRVNQKPSGPGGGQGGGPRGGGALLASGPEDVLFRLTKTPAGTSKLTVVFPQIDEAAANKELAERRSGKSGKPGALPPEAMAMMSQFLRGMKIAIIVQPVGRLVKASTPYVQGQQVTLLEMDFDQFLTNPTALQSLQNASSLEQAKTLLKDVKGVKFNPEKEVTIEFAAR